jgi:predicted site-specific integrase-resolvase
MTRSAILAARVSSDQTDCTALLKSQVKEHEDYAATNGLRVEQIIALEGIGAGDFRAMLIAWLQLHHDVRIVVVQQTDRIIRACNNLEWLRELFDNRDMEIHFVATGEIWSRNSNSLRYFL